MKYIWRNKIYAVAAMSVVLICFLLFQRVSADTVQTSVTIVGGVEAVVQWAVPQLRVGDPATNDDTVFYLTVRTSDDNDDTILFTQASLTTTSVSGIYGTPIELAGIPIGVYDLGFKGAAHLTKVLDDVTLATGTNILNFTQPDNSAPKGSDVLLAGDVSGDGTSPATLGDDVVNSVDLSILLDALDVDDLTGNNVRSNLNQDIVVNSVDLSIILDNLDLEGDN